MAGNGKERARKRALKESKLSKKEVVNKKVAKYSLMAKTLLKNQIFTYVAPPAEGENPLSGERIVNLTSGKAHRLSPNGALEDMMTYARFRWNIYIAVLYRDEDGRKAMEPTVIVCKYAKTRIALSEVLNQAHVELIDEVGLDNVVNVGWLACPHGKDIDDEFAYGMFDQMKAWDFKGKVSVAGKQV